MPAVQQSQLSRQTAPPQMHRKRVYIIDSLPIRVNKTRTALGGLYALSSFPDGQSALAAMHIAPPDAVVIDERTLSQQGGGIHRTKCNDDSLKQIPFIIMSDGHEGPFIAGDGTGAPDRFLKRPIPINLLLDHLAALMSHQVEKSWEKLPKQAGQALRSTADQFIDIAKAVANNTPLDRSAINSSCNPLIDCVSNNQHKYVLMGLRKHNNYTYTHSMRVAVFMAVFAQAYNVSKSEMSVLTTGGFLHDVGKMVMPQSLLNKTSSLSDKDWVTMRDHARQSKSIVDKIAEVNAAISVIAEQHHERLDGSGYPHGLKGSQVNELGRMAAIADVYAGLTDERPYKHALNADDAFSIMHQMGPALDQHLLSLFREVIQH